MPDVRYHVRIDRVRLVTQAPVGVFPARWAAEVERLVARELEAGRGAPAYTRGTPDPAHSAARAIADAIRRHLPERAP